MAGKPRLFPIQTQRDAKPHPLLIPWSVAEKAYSVYAGRYGKSQSLQTLADRGGFGPGEMDLFHPTWREECAEIASLNERLTQLEYIARTAILVGYSYRDDDRTDEWFTAELARLQGLIDSDYFWPVDPKTGAPGPQQPTPEQ